VSSPPAPWRCAGGHSAPHLTNQLAGTDIGDVLAVALHRCGALDDDEQLHPDLTLLHHGVARAGEAVAVWARRSERNVEAVAALRDVGADADAFTCDVAEEADIERSMAATVERFGRLDGMVANAGVAGSRTPFTELH